MNSRCHPINLHQNWMKNTKDIEEYRRETDNIENIETIDDSFIKQDYSRKKFNNKKFNSNFQKANKFKKKYNYQSKKRKHNFDSKKLANY